jgi:predicted dehydrogenase
MARLKVGIAGVGRISELHAKGYEKEARAEIFAVCDPDEDLAIRRSLDWGARRYYTDFAEMAADPEIDAIEIVTPNYLHASQAVAALQNGKHVSVERPLATALRDADAIIQAAAQSGKIVQVYEPCLFYKPLLDARALIDAGEIGNTTALHIDATVGQGLSGTWDFKKGSDWRFNPDQCGGSPMLFEVAYQAFTIAFFLVGSVERLSAWQSYTPVNETSKIDAPTVAKWKHFQQNIFGSLSFSYAPERKMRTHHHPLEVRITISGTKGEIHIIRSSDPTQLESPVEVRREARKVHYGQKNTAFEDSFVRATQNFVGACLGQEEPLLRAAEAKQLLILSRAFQESARRGGSITLQKG